MSPEIKRKNRAIRAIAFFCLAVILSTLILFFQLALENIYITYWHILLFGTSCAGCFYILFLIDYAKAQREKATIISEEKYMDILRFSIDPQLFF